MSDLVDVLELARKQGQAEMSEGLRLAFESSGVMPDWLSSIKARLEAAEKERDRVVAEYARLVGDTAALKAEVERLKELLVHETRKKETVADVSKTTSERLSQRIRDLEAAGRDVLRAMAEQPPAANAVRDPALGLLRALLAPQPAPQPEEPEK